MPHRNSEDNIGDGEESHASFHGGKVAGKPSRTKVTIAPKIYASAYSDDVWVMLKDYTKEVLRNSPKDILHWSAEYFARKVDDRRKSAAEYVRAGERARKHHNGRNTTTRIGSHQVSRESQHEDVDVDNVVSDEEADHGDSHTEIHQ